MGKIVRCTDLALFCVMHPVDCQASELQVEQKIEEVRAAEAQYAVLQLKFEQDIRQLNRQLKESEDAKDRTKRDNESLTQQSLALSSQLARQKSDTEEYIAGLSAKAETESKQRDSEHRAVLERQEVEKSALVQLLETEVARFNGEREAFLQDKETEHQELHREVEALRELLGNLSAEYEERLVREREMATARIGLAEGGFEKILALKTAEIETVRTSFSKDIANKDTQLLNEHQKVEEVRHRLEVNYQTMLADKQSELENLQQELVDREDKITTIHVQYAEATAAREQKQAKEMAELEHKLKVASEGRRQDVDSLKRDSDNIKGVIRAMADKERMLQEALHKAEQRIVLEERRATQMHMHSAVISER